MDDEIVWLDSNATLMRVAAVLGGELKAQLTIANRAHDGLIRTQAKRFVSPNRALNNFDLPTKFWWANGHEALEQNWITGDFSTWIESKAHWKAYGVRFCQADIDDMLPATSSSGAVSASIEPSMTKNAGRLPAEWWDDLWIEMCRQLYEGDLKPKKEADIKTAMLTWLENRGNSAAESTIRSRSRKLWAAIKTESKN